MNRTIIDDTEFKTYNSLDEIDVDNVKSVVDSYGDIYKYSSTDECWYCITNDDIVNVDDVKWFDDEYAPYIPFRGRIELDFRE